METFDFDEIIQRRGTDSIKWDHLKENFGSDDLLPLWVADMDFKSPPSVIRAMHKVAEHGLYGYVKPTEDYFQSVAGWMKRRFDWSVEPEWITLVPGIVPAISIALRAFTKPGDKVIVQQPVYHPFMAVTRELDREVLNNALVETETGYEINISQLREMASDPKAKALILCSPHNPVGRVWTRDELRAIMEICEENDVLLISDEIHQDLVYAGSVHEPTAKLGTEASRIITCTAPSKSFNVASLFASNIIISNGELRAEFKKAVEQLHLMPSQFTIEGVKAAYNEGEEWLEALMEYLSGNVDFVTGYLEEHLPQVSFRAPEATFLIWMDFRKCGLTSVELDRILREEARVALNKGWMFGREGEGHMRLNIGCPRSVLRDALDRIKTALESQCGK